MIGSGPGGTDSAPGVALVIQDLAPGGAERVFVDYVNALHLVSPTAVVLRRNGGLEGDLAGHVPLIDLSSASRERVDPKLAPSRSRRPSRGWIGSAWNMFRMARTLARLLREERIAVLSTFLTKSHLVAFLARGMSGRDVAIVANIHEQLEPHLRLHFGPSNRRVVRWFLRSLLPRADIVVAVSAGVRTELIDDFGVDPGRIEVLENPIDRDRVLEGAWAAVDHPFLDEPGDPVVIGVGRLVPLKGFELLLTAIAELRDRVGARLLLVGDGPERGALERRSRELGLEGRVAFVGHQPNPWRYMARADVFALPSLTEAQPNVVAEALVLGLPVVAFECSSGVSEYLEHGAAGVLVPPHDPRALSRALEPLLADEAVRATWASRSAARGSGLSAEASIRRYDRLLRSLVRNGGVGS